MITNAKNVRQYKSKFSPDCEPDTSEAYYGPCQTSMTVLFSKKNKG